MAEAPASESRNRMAQELRDAVSARTLLLVVGVALVQLGFIASYVGAFHHPAPHRIPLVVVQPAGAPATLVDGLNSVPGTPLYATAVASLSAGAEKLRRQEAFGVLEASPTSSVDRLYLASASGPSTASAVTLVLRSVVVSQHRSLSVKDLYPPSRGDHLGLSSFYLVVGWLVGGYLVASLLGVSVGARPANLYRGTIRLAAIAVYAVVSGIAGAAIVGPWLHALPANLLGLWALGALLVFTAGAVTTALQVVAGTIGIGITVLIFVVLGNPSAGGPYAYSLLPTFWRSIGPWIPNGAGVSAARAITYFGGAAVAGDFLVIAAWALAGLVVAYAGLVVAGRRRARLNPAGRSGPPAGPAGPPGSPAVPPARAPGA